MSVFFGMFKEKNSVMALMIRENVKELNRELFNLLIYSTIFNEPEENNYFSIIALVIIRATAFSFILLVSSLTT